MLNRALTLLGITRAAKQARLFALAEYLATNATERKGCCAYVDTIARALDVTERTAKRDLGTLRSIGLVRTTPSNDRQRGGSASNENRVDWYGLREFLESPNCHPAVTDCHPAVTDCHPAVTLGPSSLSAPKACALPLSSSLYSSPPPPIDGSEWVGVEVALQSVGLVAIALTVAAARRNGYAPEQALERIEFYRAAVAANSRRFKSVGVIKSCFELVPPTQPASFGWPSPALNSSSGRAAQTATVLDNLTREQRLAEEADGAREITWGHVFDSLSHVERLALARATLTPDLFAKFKRGECHALTRPLLLLALEERGGMVLV